MASGKTALAYEALRIAQDNWKYESEVMVARWEKIRKYIEQVEVSKDYEAVGAEMLKGVFGV